MRLTIAILLILGASVLRAQTPPAPAPAPPPAEPGPPPEEPKVPVQTRVGPEFKVAPTAPRWAVTLAVLGGYDSNVRFDQASEEDFGGSFRANVQRRFEKRRNRLSVVLGGSAYTYSEDVEEDNLNGNAELSFTRQISQRDTFNITGYGSYQSTATQQILTDVGIQLPRTQTQAYGGSAGFDFRIGQRGSLKLGGRYGNLAYEDPRLIDNQTFDANVTLAREMGRFDDVAFSYVFLQNEDAGKVPLQHHTAQLGWRHTLSPNLSVTVTGGVAYVPLTEGGLEHQYYPQGGVRLNGVWRRTTLVAEARQTVTPAYGIGGDQLVDIGTLSATIPFGRKVQLAITGNLSWGREVGPADSYFSQDATVVLNWRLFRYLGLGAGYTYRKSDYETEIEQPTVDGHKVYCGLTYTRP